MTVKKAHLNPEWLLTSAPADLPGDTPSAEVRNAFDHVLGRKIPDGVALVSRKYALNEPIRYAPEHLTETVPLYRHSLTVKYQSLTSGEEKEVVIASAYSRHFLV